MWTVARRRKVSLSLNHTDHEVGGFVVFSSHFLTLARSAITDCSTESCKTFSREAISRNQAFARSPSLEAQWITKRLLFTQRPDANCQRWLT